MEALMIIVTALIAGIIGGFVSIRINELIIKKAQGEEAELPPTGTYTSLVKTLTGSKEAPSGKGLEIEHKKTLDWLYGAEEGVIED